MLWEGFVEENMIYSLENWRVEMVDGMKWVFNFVFMSICCYGVVVVVLIFDIEIW